VLITTQKKFAAAFSFGKPSARKYCELRNFILSPMLSIIISAGNQISFQNEAEQMSVKLIINLYYIRNMIT